MNKETYTHPKINLQRISIPYYPKTMQTISKKLKIKELLTQIAPEVKDETDVCIIYEHLKKIVK